VIRLSDRGAAVLDDALRGRSPTGSAGWDLLDRLLRDGLIHPVPRAQSPAPDQVTFVIPARNAAAWIESLVSHLVDAALVVVVDDASTDATAELARRAGARVLRNSSIRGPGGARNTGLEAVETKLVAFIDSDCMPAVDWVGQLVGLFVDPRLAVVAPRVRSVTGTSPIERYEMIWSPLDLGPYPASVAPGRRTSYVPGTALLARVDALRAVGGFDPSLRFGEDVDLVWRLTGAGWTVRYSPTGEVAHRPRQDLAAFCRQRMEYGRSAATLERKHPGAVRPLRVAAPAAILWASALTGPRATLAGLATVNAAVGIQFRDSEMRRHAWRLAAGGNAAATAQVARTMMREWLPPIVLLSLRSRRVRRLALLAAAFDLLDPRPRAETGELELTDYLVLRVLDRAAYAYGCWQGVANERSIYSLLPRVIPARIRSRG
jgi:mycofactocin system glycosyltransferase